MNLLKDDGKDGIVAALVFIAVFLVSLVSILISLVFQADWPIAAPFFKEIGFAGIISLIVIFTVESFSRKRHEKAADALVEKINSDLFHAVYKRYIPEVVFAEVEKCLMHSGVFRHGHEVNYTIENLKGDAGAGDCNKHVKCLAQSRYTLRNVTEGEIDHPVILTLERPINPKLDGHCKIISMKINGNELKDEDILESTETTESQVVFRRNVKIPARGDVEVCSSSILLKQKTDSEIWASRLPSDGFKLTISMPGKDIKVFASALHSEKLTPILNNEVTKSWELKHGMFPFQSVVFWWHT